MIKCTQKHIVQNKNGLLSYLNMEQKVQVSIYSCLNYLLIVSIVHAIKIWTLYILLSQLTSVIHLYFESSFIF